MNKSSTWTAVESEQTAKGADKTKSEEEEGSRQRRNKKATDYVQLTVANVKTKIGYKKLRERSSLSERLVG